MAIKTSIKFDDKVTGVFTNADPEDIPKNALQGSKNLYGRRGKLIKTRGAGDLGIGAVGLAGGHTMRNLFTYVNANLPGGYAYTTAQISDADGAVYMRSYISAVWANPLSNAYYHDSARNPVVMHGGVMRVLPGAVGEI